MITQMTDEEQQEKERLEKIMRCRDCASRFSVKRDRDTGELITEEVVEITSWYCSAYDGHDPTGKTKNMKPALVFDVEDYDCPCYINKDKLLEQWKKHVPNWYGLY
jgi:hypothetical protein